MKKIELDRIGALASFACAVHCAVLPVLLGLGAAGAVSFVDHRPVEWGVVILAAIVGTVSAWRGFRIHGNRTVAAVLVMAVGGLVTLAIAHAGPEAHDPHAALSWLFPVLGLVLAVSHFVNLRLCRSCRECASHRGEEARARP